MIVRLTFLAIQVSVTLAVVIPLLLHAWMNRRWMERPFPSLESCADADLPFLFIVLPVWNESAVITKKLDDIVAQKYPKNRRRIMVIDSASTDETVNLVRDWEKKNKVGIEIIEMTARLGKSAAVNRAIKEVKSSDDVFVMSDAEAFLEPGALRRIGRWMRDPTIGAVCGTLVESTDDSAYRSWYRWFREGESREDSTPIFEGSIAAYRTSALTSIQAHSNADDSQLAVLVRGQGLRAISDDAIGFREMPITDAKENTARAIRRGQGLSRHFWRNREMWFRNGSWGKIIGLNGYQHTIAPWLIIIGILAGLCHALTVVLIGWIGSEPHILDRVMLLIDALVIFSLAIGVTGLRVPLCGTILSYLQQNLFLAYGMILLKMGRSLHCWNPSQSNRTSH